jgi:hypothetical protein
VISDVNFPFPLAFGLGAPISGRSPAAKASRFEDVAAHALQMHGMVDVWVLKSSFRKTNLANSDLPGHRVQIARNLEPCGWVGGRHDRASPLGLRVEMWINRSTPSWRRSLPIASERSRLAGWFRSGPGLHQGRAGLEIIGFP